jgi:hypothetical protein
MFLAVLLSIVGSQTRASESAVQRQLRQQQAPLQPVPNAPLQTVPPAAPPAGTAKPPVPPAPPPAAPVKQP